MKYTVKSNNDNTWDIYTPENAKLVTILEESEANKLVETLNKDLCKAM